jgi:hypothetical protein
MADAAGIETIDEHPAKKIFAVIVTWCECMDVSEAPSYYNVDERDS